MAGSLAALFALALSLSGAAQPATAAVADSSGAQASALYKKKKCKKGSKSKKCKGKKGGSKKEPWAGSGYRPGQVCSLAAHMQKKYKKYGLFCLDLGLGIWSLEPL